MSTINSVKGSDESDDSSQMLRRIDSLIDMWFTRSPPPYPPPSRPLPKLPNKAEKQREHSKQTVNKLLLRAHVALIYSSHEGATQALCYADRAFDLAVEHRIPKHRGKAQWLRGEALMRMERWEDAYGAFVSSARAVEGGWRKQGELGQRLEVCLRRREERDEKTGTPRPQVKDKLAEVIAERGRERPRKTVRFTLGGRFK